MMRFVSLVLVSLLAGCATQPDYVPAGAQEVAPAQVRVGDFWEYEVRDAYTGLPRGLHKYEVSVVDANRVVVDVTRDGQRVDPEVYSPGWNGLEHPLTNLQRFRYDPAFPAYVYPLAPGKSWYTIVNATDPVTRKTYRVHTRGKVVGWERITVPAGQFDALKIQRYVFAGNADAVKTQESIAETDWYVPALRRVARTQASSEHFDNSRGGGDGAGEYPMRVRGDWLIAELVRYSR
jgi:hypothetical protein